MPKPPYPTKTITTGVVSSWRGYIKGQIGSITSDIWTPNPQATIHRLQHNSSNNTLFLELGGITDLAKSGNWSSFTINTVSFLRSGATISARPDAGYLMLSWARANPFGNSGNTRTVTIL